MEAVIQGQMKLQHAPRICIKEKNTFERRPGESYLVFFKMGFPGREGFFVFRNSSTSLLIPLKRLVMESEEQIGRLLTFCC